MRYALLLTAVALLGCGRDRDAPGDPGPYTSIPRAEAAGVLASTLCRLWTQACGCDRNFFGTPEQCRTNSTSYLEERFREAEAAGLAYDPECAAEVVNLYDEDIACKLESEITSDVTRAVQRPYCKVFYGTDAEGAACESFAEALGDSCPRGMQCLGTCTALPAPRTVRAAGEACDLSTDICEAGTSCRASDGGGTTCAPLPTAGEPCVAVWGCSAPYYCNETSATCEELPGQDAPCAPSRADDPRCAPGFYCTEASTCDAAPGEGEACAPTSGTAEPRCGIGLWCSDATALCEPTLPEGAACDSTESCGELVCREDATDENHCLPEEPFICL